MHKSPIASFDDFPFKKKELFSLKKMVLCLLIGWLSLPVLAQSEKKAGAHPFKKGEVLTYSMHYGWFEIGEATLSIDEEWWYLEKSPHYYINCKIESTGFVGFFAQLNVCMESWVNPNTLRPLRSHREVMFGKKIDIRTDHFTYSDSVRVQAYVEDIDARRYHAFAQSEVPLFDALSTYLFLRSSEANALAKSETKAVRTFFSNDLYQFGMTFAGTSTYDWHDRDVTVRKYDLLFPKSSSFPDGKKAYVLATNDRKSLPLKFSIEMNYGDFTFELKDISQ